MFNYEVTCAACAILLSVGVAMKLPLTSDQFQSAGAHLQLVWQNQWCLLHE